MLKNNMYAKVSWPTEDEMIQYALMVQQREPEVDDVIGFADGLSIAVQCSSDELSQSADYNGYHHDTHCNNVFLFVPTGKIAFACFNFPGSWHDTLVSAELINKVVESIGPYKVSVDQGFPRSGNIICIYVYHASISLNRSIIR
jgi:hypothetical protein